MKKSTWIAVFGLVMVGGVLEILLGGGHVAGAAQESARGRQDVVGAAEMDTPSERAAAIATSLGQGATETPVEEWQISDAGLSRKPGAVRAR